MGRQQQVPWNHVPTKPCDTQGNWNWYWNDYMCILAIERCLWAKPFEWQRTQEKVRMKRACLTLESTTPQPARHQVSCHWPSQKAQSQAQTNTVVLSGFRHRLQDIARDPVPPPPPGRLRWDVGAIMTDGAGVLGGMGRFIVTVNAVVGHSSCWYVNSIKKGIRDDTNRKIRSM